MKLKARPTWSQTHVGIMVLVSPDGRNIGTILEDAAGRWYCIGRRKQTKVCANKLEAQAWVEQTFDEPRGARDPRGMQPAVDE
jgi:hypothetical protein